MILFRKNPAKEPRTNRYGITAPMKLPTVSNDKTWTGLIGREQRAAMAGARRFLRQNEHTIKGLMRNVEKNQDAIRDAEQFVKKNQGEITDAIQLAELHQIPVNAAETMMEAQRIAVRYLSTPVSQNTTRPAIYCWGSFQRRHNNFVQRP